MSLSRFGFFDFKRLLADIRQVLLCKVDDLVDGLVAYIKCPQDYVVGREVSRPHVAIDGGGNHVYIVLLVVKSVEHGHGQSVFFVLPMLRRVQRRSAVYTVSFLLVCFLRCHLGHFSVGRNLDSNNSFITYIIYILYVFK